MSHSSTPREIVDFFLDPGSYDHPVQHVEHRQTHVSHLFFAGDYVYKVKKPVDMGFLDFSTLEKRRAAAVSELELNRRTAPSIYLDLVAVHRDQSGRLSFVAPTTVQEVAVQMKRLPEKMRLSRLIQEGEARPEMMVDLGRLIANFHRRARSSPEIARYGSLETVRHNWDENFEQTEPFIGRTLSRSTWETCKREIERYINSYADLFEKRVEGGWIRDCHGDLQTDDTFIDTDTGEAYVLDCIEFNRRFRYSDTVADIAFLSMDLRHRGADELARAFLDAYYEASPDDRIPSLLRFYESYRAYVRGKVRSFVVDQDGPSPDEKAAAKADAEAFFKQSLADARRLRPRLILFAGLMGSGKTRQSEELARRAGVRVAHSDVMRKRLAGLDPNSEQRVAWGEGIYSSEWTERTYESLVQTARDELARGNSVILDASWSSLRQRVKAREAAADRGALFAIVECTAPDDVLEARLSRPSRPVTDGRIDLLADQRAAYEPPNDEEAELLIRLDTSGNLEHAAARTYDALFD